MSVNLIETIENLGIPEVPEERERFKIESKDQAAWALRKMSRIKAEQKENLPDAVVVKETVSKNPVKKHIRETGEMVPGVTITERPEKFSVEVV